MEQDNKRLKSTIKLIIWIAFIVGLLLISGVGKNLNNELEYPQNNIEDKEDVEITLKEKLDKIDSNYKYKYEIKINEITYTYNGTKLLNRDSGYRLVNDEYLYYFLENGYTYAVNNGGLDKIDSIYAENINKEYLDINRIKEFIKDIEYTKNENDYVYNLSDKIIKIFTTKENIKNVEIYLGDNYYKLEFNDIGLVKEVKY